MSRNETQRQTNILFPVWLLDEMKQLVPGRKRSQLVVQATIQKMELIKQARALQEAAGTWSDADHPDITESGSSEAWVRTIRKAETEAWMKKLGEGNAT
ncbi:hypothetical protein AUK40_05035 [Candidatus Wirthbacteria bacterium CG2_30_54_11]|uniref:Uncharacterized protein n=1 Tax=Candidatus Wirthbacteria bacterium CG2_30_54_11 TaxID=1817892 RepID=A0A1J5II94_9BACT|nr:MAG: hypothetical protein AUK40_05035 [Candidatus Wirthbacteria bacterium CG2_30_54_11]